MMLFFEAEQHLPCVVAKPSPAQPWRAVPGALLSWLAHATLIRLGAPPNRPPHDLSAQHTDSDISQDGYRLAKGVAASG